MIKRSLSIILLLLTTSSIMSCGFHLRSQPPVPPEITTIALLSENPNGQLAQQLWQIFKSAHVHVVTDSNKAPISLVLLDEQMTTHKT